MSPGMRAKLGAPALEPPAAAVEPHGHFTLREAAARPAAQARPVPPRPTGAFHAPQPVVRPPPAASATAASQGFKRPAPAADSGFRPRAGPVRPAVGAALGGPKAPGKYTAQKRSIQIMDEDVEKSIRVRPRPPRPRLTTVWSFHSPFRGSLAELSCWDSTSTLIGSCSATFCLLSAQETAAPCADTGPASASTDASNKTLTEQQRLNKKMNEREKLKCVCNGLHTSEAESSQPSTPL